jgi:hypothetical protein
MREDYRSRDDYRGPPRGGPPVGYDRRLLLTFISVSISSTNFIIGVDIQNIRMNPDPAILQDINLVEVFMMFMVSNVNKINNIASYCTLLNSLIYRMSSQSNIIDVGSTFFYNYFSSIPYEFMIHMTIKRTILI